jgi:hypothetical protein
MVLKEYVVVPDTLLKKPKELKKYFDISYDYVKTLKAKPTKEPKWSISKTGPTVHLLSVAFPRAWVASSGTSFCVCDQNCSFYFALHFGPFCIHV